jgi:hypothetical protein
MGKDESELELFDRWLTVEDPTFTRDLLKLLMCLK